MSTISLPAIQKPDCPVDSALPTTPHSDKINRDHRCYLPVSLETKPFQRPMLDAMVEWISDNFSQCVVLVCDSIHRLTLQIIRNLSEEKAKNKAIKLGEVFIAENRALFEDKMAGRFKFLKSSTIALEDECAVYQQALLRLFESDEGFKSSINQSAASYVDRRFKNKDSEGISMTRAEMMELSCKYLIEEMALFSRVIDLEKSTVDVYPGPDLMTFAEIAQGKYPDAPEPLMRRKSIELKLEKAKPQSRAAKVNEMTIR